MSELYTYAVSRIRSREVSLLSKHDFLNVISAANYDEAIKLLSDKGFNGNANNKTIDELIIAERNKTWNFIAELVEDMSVLNIFSIPNDYHNLKAAIKSELTEFEPENIYLDAGTIETEVIIKAVRERDFTKLPENMAKAANESLSLLIRTGDGQLCDIIIDKASLEAITECGYKSKNQMLKDYAELIVATSNIKTVLRSIKMNKSGEFLKKALAECKTISKQKLIEAYLAGKEEVLSYLLLTKYSEAVKAYQMSYSLFEKWCDDKIIELAKNEKYNSFTIAPIAAYILARESEIKMARIILSGKFHNLDNSILKERLRETYA